MSLIMHSIRKYSIDELVAVRDAAAEHGDEAAVQTLQNIIDIREAHAHAEDATQGYTHRYDSAS